MKKIFLFLFIVGISKALVQINSVYNLTAKDLQDSLIKITQNSSADHILSSPYNKYYSLSATNRHKRKCYQIFKHRYQQVTSFLKSCNIINSLSSLIKTQVKSRFVQKTKLWQFGINFVILLNQINSSQIKKKLEEFGVKLLKDNNVIKYLQGKLISFRVLNHAKIKLQQILNGISNQLEIKYIDNIQISGVFDFSQSDKLESELETQDFQYSHIYKPLINNNTNLCNTQTLTQTDVTIEVIFKVGIKRQNSNTDILQKKLLLKQESKQNFEQYYQQNNEEEDI